MAALDSLRSLLECSLKAYCDHAKVAVQPRQQGGYIYLDDVLKAVEQHLKANHLRRDLLNPIRKIRNQQLIFSLKEEFDSINHNPHMFTSPSEVKNAWDRIDAVIRFALDPDSNA